MSTMKLALVILCSLLMTPTLRALDPSIAPSKHRPTVGMTMQDALAYYGEPFHRAVVDGNEQWFYYLKFLEVYGRAIVPFRFDSDNVRLGSMTFGRDKKVRVYDWVQTRDGLSFR